MSERRLRQSERDVVTEMLGVMHASRHENGWSLDLRTRAAVLNLSAILRMVNLECDAKRVLDLMSQRGFEGTDSFLSIAREVRDSIKNRAPTPMHEWRFFVPIDCRLDETVGRPASVTVLGTRFYFTTWPGAMKLVGKATFETRLANIGMRNAHLDAPTCLRFSSRGVDCRDAYRRADAAFDVFRSLVEVTYKWGQWGFSWPERARRRLPHPKWFLGFSDQGEAEARSFLFDEDPAADGRAFAIGLEDFRILKANAVHLRKKPNDGTLLSLLADCHRLYVQAMHSRFNHSAFLTFWQLAEALTLSEQFGGDTKHVCSRLVWVGGELLSEMGFSRESMTALLHVVAKKRNQVVHRGVRNVVSDDDVNIIKLLCEAGMNRLLRLSSERSVTSVDEYKELLRLCHRQQKDLNRITTAIGALRASSS